jgi:U4/U6.U5 tri-snRNP component SNU23
VLTGALHLHFETDLKQLGQTTQVARSTVEQVRARLKYWQEEMKQRSKTESRQYDFEARLAEIAAQQRAEKQQRRAKRKEAHTIQRPAVTDAEAMAMMGFGNFGSSKK